MNSKRTAWMVAVAALVLSAALPGLANLTNTWNFATPANYQVSNPVEIEVTDGVAKLKLQATNINVSTVSAYAVDVLKTDALGVGPDVGIELAKSGGKYVAQGQFDSRIIDGGEGNVWKSRPCRTSSAPVLVQLESRTKAILVPIVIPACPPLEGSSSNLIFVPIFLMILVDSSWRQSLSVVGQGLIEKLLGVE